LTTCRFRGGPLAEVVVPRREPTLKRLSIGPVRFGFVYLFAGLGAGLWSLGFFPTTVSLGASGAVYGVYGCFLGCYLRATRTIPWQLFFKQTGLLLLFVLTSLLVDYLERNKTLVAHGSGLLYGFAGGLLFGPVLGTKKRQTRRLHFVFGVAGCSVLIIVTIAWVERCARPAVRLLTRYDVALEEERDLSGRFQNALRLWTQNKMSNTEFRALLENQLIPQMERLRKERNLGLPPKFADAEKERISMQKIMEAARSSKARSGPNDKRGSTEEEFRRLVTLLPEAPAR
jgi:hypothetical protein